jgi:predicted nucleotidyltransferase
MVEIAEAQQRALEELCRRFRVRRLELFGSATDERFDPATSDLDFLVEFEELGDGEHADAYFGLMEELEALFGRPVDLLMPGAITNPYFLENIQASRTVLYAA